MSVSENELFGVKGEIECVNNKMIRYKNVIRRGKGGPIFGGVSEEKESKDSDTNEEELYGNMKELLDMQLDMSAIWNGINAKTEKINVTETYDGIYDNGKYRPSVIDRAVYNKKDKHYSDIFGCFGDEVIGVSLGQNGVFLSEELLLWIQSNIK